MKVIYENIRFTAKTVIDGRLTELLVHVLDEEELAARAAALTQKEVEA